MNKKSIKNPFYQILSLSIIPILYLFTYPKGLPGADSIEFLLCTYNGGIPHPSGYPLLLIVLKSFTTLNFIFNNELKSLLVGIYFTLYLASIFTFKTFLLLNKNYLIAYISTIFIFTSPFIWKISLFIEPFFLLLFQTSVIVYLVTFSLLKNKNIKINSFIISLFYTFGASNHHSLLLISPLVILFLIKLIQNKQLMSVIFYLILGIVIGVIPLFYFYFEFNDNTWIWGDWSNFNRIFTHILRKEYGTLSLSSNNTNFTFNSIQNYFKVIYPFFIISLLSIYTAFSNKKRNEQLLISSIFLTFFITGFIFLLLFKLPNNNFSIYITRRFFALPSLILAIPLFLSLNYLSKNLKSFNFLIILLLLYSIYFSYSFNKKLSTPVFEQFINNINTVIEDNSILLCENDVDFMAGLYLKYSNKDYKNIYPIFKGLLKLPWYNKRVISLIEKNDRTKIKNFNDFIYAVSNTKNVYFLSEPYYLDKQITSNLYPIGPLLKLKINEPIPIDEVINTNIKIFNQITIPEKEYFHNPNPWDETCIQYYQRPWNQLNKIQDTTINKISLSYLNKLNCNNNLTTP